METWKNKYVHDCSENIQEDLEEVNVGWNVGKT